MASRNDTIAITAYLGIIAIWLTVVIGIACILIHFVHKFW